MKNRSAISRYDQGFHDDERWILDDIRPVAEPGWRMVEIRADDIEWDLTKAFEEQLVEITIDVYPLAGWAIYRDRENERTRIVPAAWDSSWSWQIPQVLGDCESVARWDALGPGQPTPSDVEARGRISWDLSSIFKDAQAYEAEQQVQD